MSKGAVEAPTLILARELRGRDVTVNTVAPGPLGTPEDIAAVVAALAGPARCWSRRRHPIHSRVASRWLVKARRAAGIAGGLTGVPPLLVQAGAPAVLPVHALRAATCEAASVVAVTLGLTPCWPPVFRGSAAGPDDGVAAPDSVSGFLRRHVGVPETVAGE